MAQIGTLEYEVKTTGVAEARKQADAYQDVQEESAKSTRSTASAVGNLVGQITGLNVATKTAVGLFNRLDSQTELLGSSLHFLKGQMGDLRGRLPGGGGGGGGGILGGLGFGAGAGAGAGIVGRITGALSGLSLGGLLSGGGAALAGGAAGGLALGIGGVELMRRFGILDAIRSGARQVGNMLPQWLNDAILQGISMSPLGGLAILGNFIVGTLEGGFDRGFAKAGQTVDVFIGAWRRQWRRAMGFVTDKLAGIDRWLGNISRRISNLTSGPIVGGGGGGFLDGLFGGGGGGGGDIFGFDIPFLQEGGTVLQTGAAVVHKGETVSEGGGGVTVENLTIELSGEFDPSNVDPRTLESLADRLVDAIGQSTGTISGVR